MPLVRCPKHNIPYNDENPRGCPACATEREGQDRASLMRELARASQGIRRPSAADTQRILEEAAQQLQGIRPVTDQPRPVPTPTTPLERAQALARRYPVQTIGIPLIVVFLAAILLRSGPTFAEELSPPDLTGEARPLAVSPGAPVSAVFAVLGVQPPRPHPDQRTLERYVYGSDLIVDALNGAVYAITLRVPSVSWNGMRVGMPERTAEGALALLGPPTEAGSPTTPRADTVGGWVVYPSLEGRPLRSLRAEVRPPNGCFDAVADIQPRAVGTVTSGERRYAAVGPPGSALERVVTRIIIVNRAIAGPYGPAAC